MRYTTTKWLGLVNTVGQKWAVNRENRGERGAESEEDRAAVEDGVNVRI